jgi:hypothetical protein
MRAGVGVVLLLTAIAACRGHTPEGPVPEPKGLVQDTTLKSASLLRRLAEAADGYRDGRPKLVVAARMFPHKVAGVVDTREQADSVVASRAGDPVGYEIFGPFLTQPDSLATGPGEEVVSVTVRMRSGEEKTYDGNKVDALFWSLPAFDKFVAPYLTAVAGPLYAAEQRELYRRGRSPLANSQAIPHWRSSL